MVPSRICCTLASIIVFCLAMISLTESAPLSRYHSNAYYRELDEAPEEVLMDLMERFGQTILKARDDLENSKRTVDFGLGRGFSGIQEAKHRMGMAAANFPGGPGRRRRSETEA